jgi:hypothetical protein
MTREPYSKECRDAIQELERRFASEDVELVSIEHHERWVDRTERAELELDKAKKENARLRKLLKSASDLIWRHHEATYRPVLGESCSICCPNGNPYEGPYADILYPDSEESK